MSAYGRGETIARALGAGAADYIVKPFSPTELTARVRAALRSRAEPAPFELEDLAIDYERRRVTVAGRPVELTATEYEVLRVLSINAGRVSTYGSLLRQAWSRHDGTVKPKLVHALVKRPRGKLGGGGVYRQRARGWLSDAGGGVRSARTTADHRGPRDSWCRGRGLLPTTRRVRQRRRHSRVLVSGTVR